MLYLSSHGGPSWAGPSVDVLACVGGDTSVHVSLLLLVKSTSRTGVVLFLYYRRLFSFEVWWVFPTDRSAVQQPPRGFVSGAEVDGI